MGKTIFLHIPKTGGSTLKKIIEKNFGEDEVINLSWGLNSRKAVKEQLQKIRPEVIGKASIFQGHIPFGVHQLLDEKCTYITLLRNPVERLISRYFHLKRDQQHRIHETLNGHFPTFSDYIKSQFSVDTDNNQTRVIAGATLEEVPIGQCENELLEKAKEHIQKHFSAIGITEQFDQFLLQLQLKNICKQIYYTKANRGVNKPVQFKLDASTIDFIKYEKNRLDYKLYLFVKENFASKNQYELASRLRRFQQKNKWYYFLQLPQKVISKLI